MKISEDKKNKISEQILALLYSEHPKPLFTSWIAGELARDEEFIKKLLLNLKSKKMVSEVKKNPKGNIYSRRSRWIITDNVYLTYKRLNHT